MGEQKITITGRVPWIVPTAYFLYMYLFAGGLVFAGWVLARDDREFARSCALLVWFWGGHEFVLTTSTVGRTVASFHFEGDILSYRKFVTPVERRIKVEKISGFQAVVGGKSRKVWGLYLVLEENGRTKRLFFSFQGIRVHINYGKNFADGSPLVQSR
jgi:hypothetical protein